MTNFDLIFDNGGGITLQTTEFCHHFNGLEKEAAECVSELLDGSWPDGWEGNEPEHRMEYDHEMERNGGYNWLTSNDVMEVVGGLDKEEREDFLESISGAAEQVFFEYLFALRDKRALQQ